MEFRDLKAQYGRLEPQLLSAMGKVLRSGRFIGGEQVEALEKELAEYVGVNHCITCANGTDALVLSLKAMGVKEGDAVFVPDFTFFASGEAVLTCGAVPVFVDVERDTCNISPKSLEQAVRKVMKEGRFRPKVILAVDLFGQPAEYGRLYEIAGRYHMLVLEDGAQGFGGRIGNKQACSFGTMSTTSFFPAKPLGCYGDGGAVFTNSDSMADIVRSLCVHGKGTDKYENIRVGMNSRLDALQAAVLRVKFPHFKDFELGAVNRVAEHYQRLLEGVVRTPVVGEGMVSCWAQYTIVCKSREERSYLRGQLQNRGIPTMVYYPRGLHKQKAFASRCVLVDDYENTNYLTERVLSLPIHPYLTQEEIGKVTDCIAEIENKMF